MGLKGSKCREEINRFKHASFSLRIGSCQQDNPRGNINIQTGKVSEVSKREVFEIHIVYIMAKSAICGDTCAAVQVSNPLSTRRLPRQGYALPRNDISNSISSRKGILLYPINGILGLIFRDSFTAPR